MIGLRALLTGLVMASAAVATCGAANAPAMSVNWVEVAGDQDTCVKQASSALKQNNFGTRFEVLNKGVGPALVRHVIVTVDGHPARSWSEALDLLLGPGKHHFAQSQLANRAMSPGETLQVLIPHDDEGNTLHPGTPGSLGNRFDAERGRVGVEICYCSTLGDCWTLVAGEHRSPRTTETRRCPKPSDLSFQQ